MNWTATILILSGLVVSIFSKQLARGYVAYQNYTFETKFGEREIKIGRILNVVGGILFIITGSLILIGVIEVK